MLLAPIISRRGKTMPITRAQFRKATGFLPEQDDLERCNCDKAGQLGHFMCGWDKTRDLPNFWPKYPLQAAVLRAMTNGTREGAA